MRSTIPAILALAAMTGPTAAWAVGDPPVRMTERQAAHYYATIRPLLDADGARCPLDQRPVSGLVTGGSSPQGGRQQTVLTFDKGATITVTRSWTRTAAGLAVNIQVDCPS